MHKCGFGIGGFVGVIMYGEPNSKGCGYVWEHPDKAPSEKSTEASHFCPRCGKGPWSLKYMPRTCEIKNIPYEEPTFVGQDEPERQEAFCRAAHSVEV